MTDRKEYEMTAAQLDALIDASKPVAAIMLQCGPLASQQDRANRAWCSLGDEMGFDGMTVMPSRKGYRFFSAIPKTPDAHSKGAM